MAKMYHYTVTHPKYGTAKVQAADNIGAVREAATSWGITKWTSIAREVEIRRWSAVSAKKKKNDRPPAGTASEEHTNMEERRILRNHFTMVAEERQV